MDASALRLIKYNDEDCTPRYITDFDDPMCEFTLHLNSIESAPENFPRNFAPDPEFLSVEELQMLLKQLGTGPSVLTPTPKTKTKDITPTFEGQFGFGKEDNTPRQYRTAKVLQHRSSLPGLRLYPAFKSCARSTSLRIAPGYWPSTRCEVSQRRASASGSDMDGEQRSSETPIIDRVQLDHQGSIPTDRITTGLSGNVESWSPSSTTTVTVISDQCLATPSFQSSSPDPASPSTKKNRKKIRNALAQKFSSARAKLRHLLQHVQRNKSVLPLEDADEEVPIWTDVYSLVFPSEISMDKSEEDYLRRTQREETLEALKQHRTQNQAAHKRAVRAFKNQPTQRQIQ